MSTPFTARVVGIEQNPADHGKKRYTIIVEYPSTENTDLDEQITVDEDLTFELPSTSPPG